MGTVLKTHALLLVMTTIFAMLALDIAFPALVLSVMAFSRWLLVPEMYPAQTRRRAA